MPIGRLSTTVWVEGAQHKKVQRKTAKKWYLTVLQLLDLPAPKNNTYMFITKRCLHLANVFDVFRIVLHVFRQKIQCLNTKCFDKDH